MNKEMTTMERKSRKQQRLLIFNIISLNTCIYSSLIFFLQLYLITIQIKYLVTNDNLLIKDKCVYLVCLIVSILMSIINLFISSIRIGSYTHDCVKLGKDFNVYLSNRLLALVLKEENYKNMKMMKRFFLTNRIWKNFLPIGQVIHLIVAYCLLYVDLISNKRLIALKYLPIGDIFSTKLDFLFGEPINRVPFIRNSNQTNFMKSTDDFGNSNEYSNTLISCNYLNLIIALVAFVMKVSQTFWSTNRLVSVLVLFYSTVLTLLCLVSYAAFEILFKFDVLIIHYKLNMNLIFKNHVLAFISILSITVYFLSCFLYINFAFKKYEKSVGKFEVNLFKYFDINVSTSTLKLSHDQSKNTTSSVVAETVSSSSASSSSSSSSYSSISQQITDKRTSGAGTTENTTEATKNDNKFSFGLYKEQLIMSVLFLVYSSSRCLFIYEELIIFKFTKDCVILTAIIAEFIAILIWIAGLLLITIKTNWAFRLDKNYKIVNWNWFYDYEVRPKHDTNKYKILSNTKDQVANKVESNNVLYVRDDSVLNKSLDSTSTSEVSYMPVIVSSANASTTTNNSNMSSNVSNVSESGTSGNSFSTTSNTISNILDASKLNGLCQRQQLLTQNEIDALYSKPQRVPNFMTMKEKLNKSLTESFQRGDLMIKKFNTIIENKNEIDANQNYSRCIILSNDKILEGNSCEENRFTKKRSFSQRLPKTISFDTHLGLMNQTSFRKNFNSTTVFGGQTILNSNNNLIKKENSSINQPKAATNSITKTVIFVDSSSSSPTDSGRDSLNESPVSSKQQSVQITSNSIIKNKPYNHILDTNC